jgi:hypothetical protein
VVVVVVVVVVLRPVALTRVPSPVLAPLLSSVEAEGVEEGE